jgi:integrase
MSERPRHIRTAADVVKATPGRWRDVRSQGLYLYVGPKLRRRWIFRYVSPITGKPNEHGLGELSLELARKSAVKLREAVATGIDPIMAKATERASATFGEAAEQWVKINAPGWRSDGHLNEVHRSFHVHGKPLANIPVNKITPDMIDKALAELKARIPNTGRRTLRMWERVLDLAKAKGWRAGDNPAAWRGGHEFSWPKGARGDKPHHPALHYEQMPALIVALRQLQGKATSAIALEFLILTAARTGEVCGAKWSEIDWDKRVWTLPPERTKQNRKQTVPLSPRTMQLLALQRQYSTGSEYVFTGYSKEPLADKAMLKLLKRMRPDVSVHGFRSSFRNWGGNENHPRDLLELCLGHSVGNNTELAYWHETALEKRRPIMSEWAAFCEGQEKGAISKAEE